MPIVETVNDQTSKHKVEGISRLPSTAEACASAQSLVNYVESLNGIEENYAHSPLAHSALAAREASIKLSFIEKSIREGKISSTGELVKLVHSIDKDVYEKLRTGLICSRATGAAHNLWVTVCENRNTLLEKH